MKVILLQDVPKLGRRGQIKEVADGFGRNYLMPKGLAEPATEGAVKELEERNTVVDKRAEKELAHAQEQAAQLDGMDITIAAKANEQGDLYAQVSPKMIADVLGEKGHIISLRQVTISEPIKKTGEYPVKIIFNDGIEAEVTVTVAPEKEKEKSA